MRLIDADLFMENARKELNCEERCCECSNNNLCEIYKKVLNQPTAYDVDKVVEQLEKLPDKTTITDSDAVPVFNNKGSFEGYSKTYEIEKNFIDKDKAIEIVKSGGIEESGEKINR